MPYSIMNSLSYSIINSLFGSELNEEYYRQIRNAWDNLHSIPSQSSYTGLYELSEESQQKGLSPSLMSRIKLIESRHLVKKEGTLSPIPEDWDEGGPVADWFDEEEDDEFWGEMMDIFDEEEDDELWGEDDGY